MDTTQLSQKEFNSGVKRLSRIGSATIIFLSIAVLIGWVSNITILKSILPGFTAMNPVEAVLFIFASTAVLIRTHDSLKEVVKEIAALILCIPILLIGIFTLIDYFSGYTVGLDQVLFTTQINGNHIAPNTSVNLILLSISLVSLKKHNPALFKTSQTVTLLTGILTMFAMVGYIYNAFSLYTAPQSIPMSLNSALAFTLLCATILLATPNHGVIRTFAVQAKISQIARFLFVAAITLPLISGFFILFGQQLNLYNYATGIAILIVIQIIIFTSLVWWNTHLLYKDEIKKSKMAHELQLRHAELEESDLKLNNKVQELEEAKEKISKLLNHENTLTEVLDNK